MDFQKSERLFSSKLFRYLSRIFVLYILSTIFKSFDLSFQEMQLFNTRGHLFSLFYVLFGLSVWEGAIWVSRRTERAVENKNSTARLWYVCGVLLLYGLCAALLFGFLYGLLDMLVFHRLEAWESFKAFSYDLNFGTFLFYLLILTFNGVIFYYKGWKEYQLQAERLMRENIQAKYDALRNQIDPHFFFNSLSVLTNIVYKSPDLAADYITQLAKTYRYILDKKFENLVPIQTELDFLDSYLFLIRIRHQSSIQFVSEIADKVKHRGMIPPATLQLLVENAIKHNRFSVNDPLLITVCSDDHSLTVTNHIRPKLHPDHSWGIGLENIHKRYELASGQGIQVSQEGDLFIVKIPIIFQS